MPYNCTNNVVLVIHQLKVETFNSSIMATNYNFFFDSIDPLKFTNLNYSVVAAADIIYFVV